MRVSSNGKISDFHSEDVGPIPTTRSKQRMFMKKHNDNWKMIETNAGNLKRFFATDNKTKTFATCFFYGDENCRCCVKGPNWIQRLFGKTFDKKMFDKIITCEKWLKEKEKEEKRIKDAITEVRKEVRENNMRV